MLRVIYIALLTAETTFWEVQSFALSTDCGIGFIYKDVWICELLSSIRNADYMNSVLFLLPWIFFIIYGYRRLRKYTIVKLEHCLMACLFLMYVGFFVYLALTGYSG